MRPLCARLTPAGWVREEPWPGGDRPAAVAFDGRFQVGFDGRLDNREQIWRRVADGPPPASDAEVVLASWRRLGTQAPENWEGPFAVVVLERASGEAWLARDPIGTRGLTYGRAADGQDGWLAASFPHWVARQLGADLDLHRLASFVALRDGPPGRSFFEGVREVLPGQTVALRPGRDPQSSWHPLEARGARLHGTGHPEEVARTFRDLADQACRRAVSETGRGLALLFSGGLDSTTLATSLSAIDRRPLALISWTFDSFADERLEQEAAARELGLRWQPLRLDDAVPLRDLDDWPIHPSTPEQTAFRLLHEAGCLRARELGADALAWGYGGDALFGGAAGMARALVRRGAPAAATLTFIRTSRALGLRSTLRQNLPPAWLRTWQACRPPSWLTPEAAVLLAEPSAWPPAQAATDLPRRWRGLVAMNSMEGDAHEAWFAARHGLTFPAPLRDRDLVRWALDQAPLKSLDERRLAQRQALDGRIAEPIRARPPSRPVKGTLEPLLRAMFRHPGSRANAHALIADGTCWPRLVRRGVVEDIWRRGAPESQEFQILWAVLSLEIWCQRRPWAGSHPDERPLAP